MKRRLLNFTKGIYSFNSVLISGLMLASITVSAQDADFLFNKNTWTESDRKVNVGDPNGVTWSVVKGSLVTGDYSTTSQGSGCGASTGTGISANRPVNAVSANGDYYEIKITGTNVLQSVYLNITNNSSSSGTANYSYHDSDGAVISGGSGSFALEGSGTCATPFTVTPPENAKSLRIIRAGSTIRIFRIQVWTESTASSTTAPTTQASDISFTDITTNSITVNWTNGDGANRAVFVKEEAGSITNPTDGTTYTASADWATKGDQLGTSGYYCVYNGTGNSVGLTNLDLSKSYTVQIFEYNGDSGEEAYFTDAATNNPNTHAATLPISLTSFKATAQTNGIQLNWATSSENNANKFVVERKSADTDFANLIEIKAKGQASNYAITDKNVASGETYYYRLKMVDKDGSFSYSNVSSAKFSIETSKLTAVYPNPATHSITVSYPETGNTVSSLTITDTKGSVVLTAVIPANSAQQTIDISGLKTGIYIININTNEGRKTLKLVKN